MVFDVVVCPGRKYVIHIYLYFFVCLKKKTCEIARYTLLYAHSAASNRAIFYSLMHNFSTPNWDLGSSRGPIF